MTKFKQYYQNMIKANKDAFDHFTKLHMEYSLDQKGNQERFNKEGENILNIIRLWEGKLCRTQEKTYSQYAGGLADKFWEEVRKHFPKIDNVGLISEDTPKKEGKEPFDLKKLI